MMEINRHTIVFDSGPGTMRRLLEAGKTLNHISHIFYSHFHPDHTSEMIPVLFATRYHEPLKRQGGITLTGGNRFLEFFDRLKHAYGNWMAPEPDFLTLIEMNPDEKPEMTHDDFTVRVAKVAHADESVAYRISTSSGKSVVYSGDTDFSENLIELSKNADLLICETAFPDEFKKDKHSTPAIAGEMAEKAGVRKLVITHFYPVCEKVDLAKQCRRAYSGPLILAEDLLRIRV